MSDEFDTYSRSMSRMQDRLLEEILYRRRRRTILSLSTIGVLVIIQVVVIFLMTNKSLGQELRDILNSILPVVSALVGFLFGRNFNSSTEELQKYKIDDEFNVLNELSRKDRDLMILRDELVKSRRASS
jgi:hypothetical protein